MARYPDISVVRLLEEMRRRGYEGGYTIIRQRVKQLRPQRDRPPVERFETGPGVQAPMGTYRREDLLAALDRAVRYGAFSVNSVERILAVRARPKTCFDRMAEAESSHLKELLSDEPTPPRPATEYQQLLFEESDQHDNAEEDTDKEEDTGQEDDTDQEEG